MYLGKKVVVFFSSFDNIPSVPPLNAVWLSASASLLSSRCFLCSVDVLNENCVVLPLDGMLQQIKQPVASLWLNSTHSVLTGSSIGAKLVFFF